MSFVFGRPVAGFVSRASASRRFTTLAAIALLSQFMVFSTVARAVVVRGVVTDALGKPVPGSRIQLIQGPKAVAVAVSGADGSYEIRSTESGRFTLLTSSATFFPGVGENFYGGSTDVMVENIVLETTSVKEEVTVTATGTPTPIAQSSSAVTLIPAEYLATTVGVSDALRQSPGVVVVQT
ncbi:MAG: TonB-dependent receptor, partial [Acidobacteriota bacterium]|nr:TonB-dependent receptor [Acidobacteriota bacterium]